MNHLVLQHCNKIQFSKPKKKMTLQEKITAIFPEDSQIPESYRIEPVHQKEYLVNGQMRQWTGATQDVFSPVFVKEKGEFVSKHIGSYPITGETEAMEALNAAVKAYDNGRGEWPMMSVADRIVCMEKFIKKMLERKQQIVNLLMYEIGKSLLRYD